MVLESCAYGDEALFVFVCLYVQEYTDSNKYIEHLLTQLEEQHRSLWRWVKSTSLTNSSIYKFDLDHRSMELANGLFYLVPKAPLGAKISRGYLESSIPLIKVKQWCQKLSLSEGPAQNWEDGGNHNTCQGQGINLSKAMQHTYIVETRTQILWPLPA